MLTRNLRFNAVCACSLAVGIGLTAALASVADALLFRPLPVPRPQEIVRIFTVTPEQPRGLVSYLDFRDMQRATRTLRGVAAQTQVLVAVGGGDRPAKVRLGLAVSLDYFNVLGVSAGVGRTFRDGDWSRPVIVLADAFWRSEFGADRGLIGRTVLIGGTPFTVLGIAPRSFGIDRFVHESFYVPMGVYESGLLPSNGRPMEDRERRFLTVIGRLAGAVRAEVAQTELGHGVSVLTETESRRGEDRTLSALAWLLVAMALVLLTIAIANTGGLLLADADLRVRERAIREALGATKARLLRDRMVHVAAIAAAATPVALPLAWAAVKWLASVATLPTDFPFAITPAMDARVLMVAAATCGISTVICGCAPLVVRHGETRWRGALLLAEVVVASAFAAVDVSLVMGARSASRVDLGYRTDHVLLMALDPAQVRYSPQQTRAFYKQLLERMQVLPGIKSAALAQSSLLGYTRTPAQVEIDGRAVTVWMNSVTPGYFGLMRMPLLSGRAFDADDMEGSAPVAIVNAELARRCGGSSVRVNGTLLRVVGVVPTVKYFTTGEAAQPYLYVPSAQRFASRMVLHLETWGEPATAVRGVVEEIRRMDPSQPMSEIRPLRDFAGEGGTFQARVAMYAVSVAGVCAVALALAGVAARAARSVARRKRDIGIQMALGAPRHAILAGVLRGIIPLIIGGAGLGWGAALEVVRVLSPLLPGPGHAGLAGWGAGAVAIAGVIAALVPAGRCLTTDPMAALREE